MALYATVEDFRDYVQDVAPEVLTLPDNEGIERLLEQAQRDVDRAAGPWPVLSTGLKFEPVQLTPAQQDSLMRATCAAVEFRLVAGDEAMIGADDGIASVAGVVTFSNRPPLRAAPKLVEELSGSELYLYSGTLPVEDGTP